MRVVVLLGAGPIFCAGADVAELDIADPSDLHRFIALGNAAFQDLRDLPQPVIAGIQGQAVGGGLELALACDLRIASVGTQFGLPEITLAGVPGWGGTRRLQEVIGAGTARHMAITGTPIDVDQALQIGLISSIEPVDRLRDACLAMADSLAEKDPTALRYVKAALTAASPYESAAHRLLDELSNVACMYTDGRRDAIARFQGRR